MGTAYVNPEALRRLDGEFDTFTARMGECLYRLRIAITRTQDEMERREASAEDDVAYWQREYDNADEDEECDSIQIRLAAAEERLNEIRSRIAEVEAATTALESAVARMRQIIEQEVPHAHRFLADKLEKLTQYSTLKVPGTATGAADGHALVPPMLAVVTGAVSVVSSTVAVVGHATVAAIADTSVGLSVGLVQDWTQAEDQLRSTDIDRLDTRRDGEENQAGVNESDVVHFIDGTIAVFKPQCGETKQALRPGIDPGHQMEREIASWELAKLVGMGDLVAPAVERTIGKKGRGVVSAFQPGVDAFYCDFTYDGDRDLVRAAAFDFVLGNMDRHLRNWIVEGEGQAAKLHLIDHGLTFSAVGFRPADWICLMVSEAAHRESKDPAFPRPRDCAGAYVRQQDAIRAKLRGVGIPDEAVRLTEARITALAKADSWSNLFNGLY